MTGQSCDIAIVGGGLAGGLIALAVAGRRPDLSLRLIEGGTAVGGNHRWSWFASDLSPEGAALMERFPAAHWASGYDVAFPGLKRHLATPYHSLASDDFAATLARELPKGTIITGCGALALDRDGVSLDSGERITARAVVDCRGFAPSAHLQGGWQAFMGRHLRLAQPHGVIRPVIMDATVKQLDGYRFVYVLPLTPNELFVEDTYYNDGPELDRTALGARISSYCDDHGWAGEVIGEETGLLPVVTGGDFAEFQAGQRIPGVAMAGARAGYVHPLTSYTLPFAVETALAIAQHADLPGDILAALLEQRARDHWRSTRFYRMLGAMLFGSAAPEQRYRVFERFYHLPKGLIERFYAARSTRFDMARLLCGKPPVPISGALRALVLGQPRMKEAA